MMIDTEHIAVACSEQVLREDIEIQTFLDTTVQTIMDNVSDADKIQTTRLALKKLSRNAYMRLYRAHLRRLPTYAVLSKYRQSPIFFSTQSALRCTAEINEAGNLFIRIIHGPELDETREFPLTGDVKSSKAIVKEAILQAYKTQ